MTEDASEAVTELINDAAEKWDAENPQANVTPAHVEFMLTTEMQIDISEVSDEHAERAREIILTDEYDESDVDELVGILKEYGDEEAVEQFRAQFIAEPGESGGEAHDAAPGVDEADVAEPEPEPDPIETPDENDLEDVDDVEELRAHVAELTQVVKKQNNQLQSAMQNARDQQRAASAEQQQMQRAQAEQQAAAQQDGGGGGGMLGNMSEAEVRLLSKIGDIVSSNRQPSPWEEKMENMQSRMFEAQMNQLQSQVGETPGQKVGRMFDEKLAEEALGEMEINFGSSGGSDSDDE